MGIPLEDVEQQVAAVSTRQADTAPRPLAGRFWFCDAADAQVVAVTTSGKIEKEVSMGVFLVGAIVLGLAVGLTITGLFGTLAILLTIINAQRRIHVWRSFAAVFAVVLALLMLAVYLYPYELVRPGSDYDIAMKNFFMQALGYSASAGGAALLASLATLLCPKKPPILR